jgi:Skp family chaperone for outer membrane proteins
MDVSLTDLFKVVAGILGSIAGGGVIVAGFAKWVGGIYANRLVEALKAKYARELESLRNTYAGELEGLKSSLATSQRQLQATLDRTLRKNPARFPPYSGEKLSQSRGA